MKNKNSSAPSLEKFHSSARAIHNFMRASLSLLDKKAPILQCDSEQLNDLLLALRDTQTILTEAVEIALPFLEKTKRHDVNQINQMYLSYNALFNRLEDAKHAANLLMEASPDKETESAFGTVLVWVYLCYYTFTVMVNFIEAELLKTYPVTGPFPYHGYVGNTNSE